MMGSLSRYWVAKLVAKARLLADTSSQEEARAMTAEPDFKGYIHDVGGPTANFRGPACQKQEKNGVCMGKKCLYPLVVMGGDGVQLFGGQGDGRGVLHQHPVPPGPRLQKAGEGRGVPGEEMPFPLPLPRPPGRPQRLPPFPWYTGRCRYRTWWWRRWRGFPSWWRRPDRFFFHRWTQFRRQEFQCQPFQLQSRPIQPPPHPIHEYTLIPLAQLQQSAPSHPSYSAPERIRKSGPFVLCG